MTPGSSPEEGFRRSNRFVVERRLGAGGFGVVFQVFDKERGGVVALKSLRRAGAEALYRFKQEFRALADLSHPNLVTLYELMSDAGEWFFTMELIRGSDFLQYVRVGPEEAAAVLQESGTPETRPPSGESVSREQTWSLGEADLERIMSKSPGPSTRRVPPNVGRLRATLRQVTEGLSALHDSGKLHRDIKPSNVLVTAEGRVKILDFGLITDLGIPSSDALGQSVQIVGTPSYMAPELATGRSVSASADWYSVGVLLYEALTGRLPFEGKALEVLALKQTSDPTPPAELFGDVPADLDALCRDLLRRDPGARPSGIEVLRRLAGVPIQPIESRPPVPPATFTPPLVGRKGHLERLHDALRATSEGRAVIAHVAGRSGVGKTALLREFFDEVRQREPSTVILAGRCYQQESVPYKALDSLMDGLSHFLKGLRLLEAEALMPQDGLALARLFPVLMQAPAVAQSRRQVLEISDPRELRRRAFAALREMLARIADRMPLILSIDDLQWGDLDSVALLGEVLRPPDPPALLLVAAYRSEDTASPVLRALFSSRAAGGSALDVRSIGVSELDPKEARQLARIILEGRAESAAVSPEAIARESGGNPFFIHELARLAPAEAGWISGRSSTAEPSITTLDALIQERVSRLPGEARHLLEVVSVSGRPLERGLAKLAAELADEEQAALALLRVWRLVRATGSSDREEIETYHDRIREAVVRQLSEHVLRARHRSLATAMEATGRPDPERLSAHLQAAGDPERAARYAAEAAERAARALAFDRAARLYRLALELRPPGSPDEVELRVALGVALGNAGRGAEAAEAYLAAASGARPAERLELQRLAAEQLLRSGHVDEGLGAIAAVLDAVGLQKPRSRRHAITSLLRRRLQIRLRGLRFRERDESEIAPATLIRIDTCWAVAIGLGFVDTTHGAAFQAKGLLLALKAGEPYRIARALAIEAAYSSATGGRSRARTAKLNAMAMDLARRLNRDHALGVATATEGIAAHFEGRWRECRETLERAEGILRERCTGVAFELDNTLYCTLFSLFFLGEIRELSRRVPPLLKDADERGDLYSGTNLRLRASYVARLAADQIVEAREDLTEAIDHWSRQGFQNQHWWNLHGRAQIHLYSGESVEAWEAIMEQWPALSRSFVLRIQLIRLLSQHLQARCALAAAGAGVQGESLLRVAEKNARRIEAEQMTWAEPLARLVRAGIASLRGRRGEAAQWLVSAEEGCRAADMMLYAAAARRSRGQLIAGAEGETMVAETEAWMQAQGILNPGRMTAMLAPGRWTGEMERSNPAPPD